MLCLLRNNYLLFYVQKFSVLCFTVFSLIIYCYYLRQVPVHLGGHGNQRGSQKAISLPSSPHEFRNQTSERSGSPSFVSNDAMVSTWNRILETYTFQNKALLPYEEWNIDFSELTVGTRVGIGNCFLPCLSNSLIFPIRKNVITEKVLRACGQGLKTLLHISIFC